MTRRILAAAFDLALAAGCMAPFIVLALRMAGY